MTTTRPALRSLLAAATAAAALAFAPLPVSAVGTSAWVHTSENDFKDGTFDNVVATNLGDLKLSRAVKTLLEQDPRIASVHALVELPDGTIYAGTGPQALLLQVKGDAVTTVGPVEGATHIFSLAADKQGRLLVGTGGEQGRVLRVEKPGEKPKEIFKADGVQYVWGIHVAEDGAVYAATGPGGNLYEVVPEGAPRLLLDSEENNLLSVTSDGTHLYVGSDPNGLIFRVDRKTGESFILYDAPETEVASLVLDKRGNLYAGTAEARDEPPAPPAPAAAAPAGGRPEGGAAGVPIPSQPAPAPEPPALPDPNPGQPKPIPKAEGAATPAEPKPADAKPEAGNAGGAPPAPAAEPKASAEPGAPPAPGAKAKPGEAKPAEGVPAEGKPDGKAAESMPAADAPAPAASPAAEPAAPKPPARPKPAPNPNPQPAANQGLPGRQPAVNAGNAGEPRPDGNAVYRIDRDGFVTEIFRQRVLVLSMAEKDGTLLLATGSDGVVFQVNPAAEETVVLAKVDPKQVMCLLPARDGKLYLGMANVGGIAAMSPGFAAEGSYTSPVLDASQVSRFGKLQMHGTLPEGTGLKVSTRSGNVRDSGQKSWSPWSEPAPAAEFVNVASPSARFLQYRLSFTSKGGGAGASPVVEDVSVAYQVPNMPPQIKSIKAVGVPEAAAAAVPGGAESDAVKVPVTRRQAVSWEAADPNGDLMQFALYFRRGTAGPWVLLKERMTENGYDWDTRSVADGRYELRVVATDAKANPAGAGRTAARVSDPITVDNTPPLVGDLKWQQEGQNVKVNLKAVDRSGTVAAVEYSLDASRDWQLVLPSDNIFDGPDEAVSFSVPGLSPGPHQVTVRATDAKGNQAYENLLVQVEGAAAAK